MSQTQSTTSPLPVVELINNRPATTSLKIAECFGKRHCDVMRDIQKLIEDCPEDFRQRNFALTFREVPGPNGAVRKEPYYIVYFDGFILLVMGYTGPKALKMKLAYIEAFNAMKAKLEASRKPGLDQADAPITPDQQCTLRAIVKAKIGDETNRGKLMRFYGQVWSRFSNHFRLAKYSQLPQSRMSEAVAYLVNLEIRTAKNLEAQPEQAKLKAWPEEDTMILDGETYKHGKRLFDQLADLKMRAESLREIIHIMARPGAKLMNLSPEKQILYDNMNDAVNGAVTGMNIAFYNLRSAARIGSRTDFLKW